MGTGRSPFSKRAEAHCLRNHTHGLCSSACLLESSNFQLSETEHSALCYKEKKMDVHKPQGCEAGAAATPTSHTIHTNRQSHTQQTPALSSLPGFCLMYTRKEEVSMAGFRVFPHKCSQRKTCMDRHMSRKRFN